MAQPPVVAPASRDPLVLSFWNLIECHMLSALRRHHRVRLGSLQTSIRYAERELGIDRLLLSQQLLTTGGKLFLEHYSQLVDIPASAQLALTRLFDDHLERVEWDEHQLPVRLFPFLSSSLDTQRPVAIDPAIAFGRPTIHRQGISSVAITVRIDAGETVEELARDYDLESWEIDAAIRCEQAA